MAHTPEDDVEDRVGVVEEELDRDLGVGGLASVVDVGVADLSEVAGADVEVNGQAHVLRLVPERVPVAVGDPRQAEGVGLIGHQHAAVAAVVGALHLVNAGLHVPEGHGHDRDEPLRLDRCPVDEEVVVGADAVEAQLVIGELEEVARAEAADVRIDDLGVHAVLVHALQALADFPGAVVGFLEAGRVVRRRRLPAGHGGAGRRHELLAAHDPAILVDLRVEDHVRHEVAPLLRRDPIGPQRLRFGDVGVRVDHLDPVADHLSHRNFPSCRQDRLGCNQVSSRPVSPYRSA